MATLLPEGKQSFTNSAGAPLVGGKLYTYDAGTNNPRPTYQDAAGTVPNTNPVILDARGEALVYWNGSYKVILKDANDVTIWTVDNVISVDVYANAVGNQVRADLLSTASATVGAGMVAFLISQAYGAGTVGGKLREWLSVWDFMTSAQIADVRAGTFTQDVTAAMNTAAATALAQKKGLYVPSGGYKMTAPWVVPPEVYVRGESLGMETAYDPAGTLLYGSVIFKAHTGHGITKTGTSAYYCGAPIEQITISSSRSLYPGGNGIVLDKVSNCHIIRCNVFGVGGDCYQLGVSAGDVTGHNYVFNCYSNNPTGCHYRVRQKWGRYHYPVSDGGTHGMILDSAPESEIDGFHFEGATTAAIRIMNGSANCKFIGKGFINMTATGIAQGIIVDNYPGNQGCKFENIHIINGAASTAATFTGALVAATSATLTAAWAGATGLYTLCFSDGSVRTGVTLTNGSTAVAWSGAVTATAAVRAISKSGSIGVDLQGTASSDNTVSGCTFEGWDIGVNDNGTSDTRIQNNIFDGCRLPISANSAGTFYDHNTISNTLGDWSIDHVGFTSAPGGIWESNILDKPIKPTWSGVNGNFGNNQVRQNRGFRTSSKGVTSLVSTGITVAHGLAGIPDNVLASIYFGSQTNFNISNIDATNITFSWTGGGSLQISWQASLKCENQI